jgi:hypothetical protein
VSGLCPIAGPFPTLCHAFFHVRRAGARRRSVRGIGVRQLRDATRSSAARRHMAPRPMWPDGMRPSARQRSSAASGQLVGSWTRIRATQVFSCFADFILGVILQKRPLVLISTLGTTIVSD